MINRGSGGTVANAVPIGEAIADGAGAYANEIMNTRDAMEREYGGTISKIELYVADLGGDALGAYSDTLRSVYMSSDYVSNTGLTEVMKVAEKSGFHPPIGNKTGAEAVASHEIGHYLGYRASEKAGISERDIVKQAGKEIGVKVNKVASKISEYARYNYKETIAEAFSDVFCNGNKASKASIAIVNVVKGILKK